MPGFTVWMTGLSGAGKSTIAEGVATQLRARQQSVEVLDGDVVRTHLSKGLGFSKQDRDTNIRRIAWVAGLLTRHGVIAITAAISPYRDVREEARAQIGRFVEVYCDAPLEVLTDRDPKGLYKKALAGEIKNFTGVNDPYEPPHAPEVHLRTDRSAPQQGVAHVLRAAELLGYLPVGPLPATLDDHQVLAQIQQSQQQRR